MKQSWFLFFVLLLTSQLVAQVKINGIDMIWASNREGRGLIQNVTEIEGSPFLSSSWSDGKLVMSNGLQAVYEGLNFDLYSNKPAFKEGGQMYHFRDPVREIQFTLTENGISNKYHFRNEYPESDKLDRTVYYQVIQEGSRFHLLKLLEKVVKKEMFNIGVYSQKFEQVEEWYLFDVALNKLVKMPRSKKELLKISEGLSPALNMYLKENSSINPKNPDELVELVTRLNQ